MWPSSRIKIGFLGQGLGFRDVRYEENRYDSFHKQGSPDVDPKIVNYCLSPNHFQEA